jgi:5-methylcytosine-specific restriction endonuclease McrA
MEYKEQLLTSDWLKKRAEIMQRDNFVCSKCLCDNYENRLEVHHIAYLYNKKAWEYPDYLLVTLCRNCHQTEHDLNNITKPKIIKDWILKLLKSKI